MCDVCSAICLLHFKWSTRNIGLDCCFSSAILDLPSLFASVLKHIAGIPISNTNVLFLKMKCEIHNAADQLNLLLHLRHSAPFSMKEFSKPILKMKKVMTKLYVVLGNRLF